VNRPCVTKVARQRQWDRCLAGHEPAEVLSSEDRAALVAHLHGLGWSIAEVAVHTRLTDYTVSRLLRQAGARAQRGAA
jgi:hypothetical protein